MNKINNRIYNKLDQLTGCIDSFLKSKGYLRLQSSENMDLIVEKIALNEISLAHYYEQNGDLCQDPKMTVKNHLETKQIKTLYFQNCFIYPRVHSGNRRMYHRRKNDLNTFLNQRLIVHC